MRRFRKTSERFCGFTGATGCQVEQDVHNVYTIMTTLAHGFDLSGIDKDRDGALYSFSNLPAQERDAVVHALGRRPDAIIVPGHSGAVVGLKCPYHPALVDYFTTSDFSREFVIGSHSTNRALGEIILREGANAGKDDLYFHRTDTSTQSIRAGHYARGATQKVFTAALYKVFEPGRAFESDETALAALGQALSTVKRGDLGITIGYKLPRDASRLPELQGFVLDAIIPLSQLTANKNGRRTDQGVVGYELSVSSLPPSVFIRSVSFQAHTDDFVMKSTFREAMAQALDIADIGRAA